MHEVIGSNYVTYPSRILSPRRISHSWHPTTLQSRPCLLLLTDHLLPKCLHPLHTSKSLHRAWLDECPSTHHRPTSAASSDQTGAKNYLRRWPLGHHCRSGQEC